MNVNNLLKKYVFWPEIENDFHKNIDFSQTPIAEISKEIKKNSQGSNTNLTSYILKFYGYNEYLSQLRNGNHGIISKNDLEIFSEYKKFLDDFSKKMFSYITYCCIAEARHSYLIDYDDYRSDFDEKALKTYKKKSLADPTDTNKDYKKYEKYVKNTFYTKKEYSFKTYLNDQYSDYRDLPKEFADEFNNNFVIDSDFKNIIKNYKKYPESQEPEFKDFINYFMGLAKEHEDHCLTGESGELQRHLLDKNKLEDPLLKGMSTEKFLRYISVMFLEGFHSGYGNEAWSDIAKHALKLSKGEINTEMFLDQALSLEHNGGNMFNKEFIFDMEHQNYGLYTFIKKPYTKKNITSESSVSTYYNYFDASKILFNLQNSSSVFMFHYLEKFKQIYEGKVDVKETVEHYFQSQNEPISYTDLESISNATKLQATTFYNFLNAIYEPNKDFINKTKLAQKLPLDIKGFALSHAKTQKNTHEEDNLIKYGNHTNILSYVLNEGVVNSKKIAKKSSNKEISLIFNCYDLTKENNSLTKEVIGGKAFGVAELMKNGFSVPKAIVFDTQTCLSYLQKPAHFNKEFKSNSAYFSNYLKDETDGSPILVSVRSGAPISMPGMMDSILNVGIDENTYIPLVEKYGKKMIHECAISFMKQFCSSKLNLDVSFPKKLDKALDLFAITLIKNDIPCDRKNRFPLTAQEQVRLSSHAVFDSWNSPRAIAWRTEKDIDHTMGTAATVQQMVFGNKNNNSLTCVIFSRDCITGKPEMMGEYLSHAQGEDLVSGRKTPMNITQLKETHPAIYNEIETIAVTLEKQHKAIQDIEITVEDGKVYVLQKRNAVVSSQAQLALAKEMGLDLIHHVAITDILSSIKVDTDITPTYKGLSANPGIISGIVVKSEADVKKYQSSKENLIFCADQAVPEHAPIMIATNAFITQSGGATSHAAILARSMNKPCIVGLGKLDLASGQKITLDANLGLVWNEVMPVKEVQEEAEALSNQLLKEKKVEMTSEDNPQFFQFKIASWMANLTQAKEITSEKKFTNFLSLAQKAAVVLVKEQHKNKLKM